MGLNTGVWRMVLGMAACTMSCRSPQTPPNTPPATEILLVSAASSLTEVMNEIGAAFSRENPKIQVRFNFAASGVLLQQIEEGAPVDVFASASSSLVDALEKTNRVEPGTRFNFAGNRLVLIAPAGSPLKGWEDLKLPSVKRVAISNPDSVPSGRYAKETLTARGLWDTVAPKAVFGENVRQTLSYAASGDVEAALVFATDALLQKEKVIVIAESVSGRDHPPIVYPAVVLTAANHKKAAKRFAAFLRSQAAQAILSKYGFRTAEATNAQSFGG